MIFSFFGRSRDKSIFCPSAKIRNVQDGGTHGRVLGAHVLVTCSVLACTSWRFLGVGLET